MGSRRRKGRSSRSARVGDEWVRRGDAYDNALAETVNGLYKAETIYHLGPWKGLEDVEYATLEWVSWFNTQRLLEPLGYLPPAEYEEQFHQSQLAHSGAEGLN